ncbi:MAG TPA: NAD(P)/FAD-dependent oxidoreductase [Dissulfurispiraceae bacterium]|nr:NAD(P)/FAD-dependent oxidoreductase [Dissulfurispiraceae bacterium]
MNIYRSVQKDVVIIGAGASGLMCAIEAGKRGRSVVLIDHMGKIGSKIRVSGGGRCNFTNINLNSSNYISANPHFCKSALARFAPRHFMDILEKHGIDYYEKEKGQLFCRKTAGEIVRMLHDECRRAGVEIMLNCKVGKISRPDVFCVSLNNAVIKSSSLVIATGGLSHPDLGATDFGLRLAKKYQLNVHNPRPALVPLVFDRMDSEIYKGLSGLSFRATVSCRKRYFDGEVLFTHRGLSGPAILQISSYWSQGEELILNLFPDIDILDVLTQNRNSRVEMANLLADYIPRRLALKWTDKFSPSRPLSTYSEKELKEISVLLHNWKLKPQCSEGYKKAEITAGGVDTDELSSKTMETKKVPGLYFIGEVVDVSGQLGGYNLHWAWSSGFAAGQYV